MIYAVGNGIKSEIVLIEKEIRNRTAFNTDERLSFIGIFSWKAFEKFLQEDHQADIICVDVTIIKGIAQAEILREKYPAAVIIVIADTSVSPVDYMKPTILAASLLLKPLQADQIGVMLEQIFKLFEEKESEALFVVENREEKYRIPYSKILYFEARSKKIYVCTQTNEYGFYDTMEHLEELYSDKFVRCHRSFMVNRKMISQIKLSHNYLTLDGGIEIPLSRSYKSRIKENYG